MQCPICTAEVPEQSTVCPHCANPISQPEITQSSASKETITWGWSRIVALIIMLLIAGFLIRALINRNSDDSKQQYIHQMVTWVREQTTLPRIIDDNVTWESIEEEQGAIVYTYTIKAAQNNSVTNESLKAYLAPNLCENSDTRQILDKGIEMHYAYHIDNTSEDYLAVISASDCK